MGLIAYTSQTYHKLLEKWIEQILSEQRSMGPHMSTVLVPNHRVASWLNQSMAERLGVSMNLRFIYLDSLIAAGEEADVSGGSGTNLSLQWASTLWSYFQQEETKEKLLPFVAWDKEQFVSQLQCMQISWEFSVLFQKYAEHRPPWLLSWENGKTTPSISSGAQEFQQKLYRSMLQGGAPRHPIHQFDSANLQNLQFEDSPVHCFGFWNFSPGKWQVIEAVAQITDIFLYLPIPTEGFLADLTRKKLQQPLLLGEEGTRMGPNYQLLSKLGQRGRALQIRLLDHEVDMDELSEVGPGPQYRYTRLQLLQEQLRDPDSFKVPSASAILSINEDPSVQIHSVWNLRREVEVAKSLIQKALKEHPDLELESIQIQAPDIAPYTPLFMELFNDENAIHAIPFSVHNSVDADNVSGILAVIELIQLLTSDWEVKEILSWLALEPVRNALEFRHADLELVRHWFECASIFRGKPGSISQENRAHSWESGMQLLMQAYAGTLKTDALGHTGFELNPPHQHPETFAKLCSWYGLMKQFASLLENQSQTASQFRSTVARILSQVLPKTNEFEKQVLLNSANQLSDCLPADFRADTATFLYLLRKQLPKLPPPRALGRKSGVQCTSIQYENLTPCRVRILLGMNESDFPAVDIQQSHDLLQFSENLPDDPSRKEDQRYWVLQSLHQTSEQWIVVYQGQDNSGNASRLLSPSVEAIIQSINRMETGQSTSALLLRPIQHPRFNYDPGYFQGHPEKVHFSVEDFEIASKLQETATSSASNAGATIADRFKEKNSPDESTAEIPVWELASFFSHPNQYVCQKHLNLRFANTHDFSPDHEPLLWAGLSNSYGLRADMLRSEAKGLAQAHVREVLGHHHTLLPDNLEELGMQWIRAELESIDTLKKLPELQLLEELSFTLKTTELKCGVPLQHAVVDAPLHSTATLATIRASNLTARHRVEAWIQMLGIWMHQEVDERRPFALIGKNTVFKLDPPAEPETHLSVMAQYFQQYQCSPVPFFPRTSEAFVRQFKDLDTIDQHPEWEGERGEKLDPYNEYMFREHSPFTASFSALAKEVFTPILIHSPSIRWKGGNK